MQSLGFYCTFICFTAAKGVTYCLSCDGHFRRYESSLMSYTYGPRLALVWRYIRRTETSRVGAHTAMSSSAFSCFSCSVNRRGSDDRVMLEQPLHNTYENSNKYTYKVYAPTTLSLRSLLIGE